VAINFTPTSAGAFTDKVIFVTNGGNSTNQVTGSGAITPAANFTGAPTAGAASLLVTFTNTSTGTITNQLWTFGDGGNSGSVNPSHSYTNAATFSVSLTVLGPLGSSNLTRSSYITVTNVLPQLTVTPASRSFGTLLVGTISTQNFSVINSGLSTLTGTATVSGTSFALLSGGTFSLSAAQTSTVAVTFSPGSAAAFTGSVVFASNGGVSTNAVTGAGATAPVAGFTGAPTNGAVSLLVTFTNASTGTITNQLWSFGDSGTSSSATPSHTYTNAGTFSVSLSVFGPLGSNTLTRSSYITATNAPPVASFTASPTNGAAPLIVSFTDASTGSITNRLWNFGDGNISSSTSPTHVYTNAGAFTVSLTVRGPTGSNTLTRAGLIVVTGIAKNSVVGDWEITVSGADKGIGFVTFSNNATATGYEIRMKTFGLDMLSGTWSNDAKGKLVGSFIERLGNATNWTGALVGSAKTDKSLSTSIITNGAAKAGFKWKGIPATDFPDLSGTWSGQVTIAKSPSNVLYAITANATNSAVFDVARTTTNTVIGQFIATSKDAVTGFLPISSNQTTLSGKFKVKTSKVGTNQFLSFKGGVLGGSDKITLDLIK
jgi:PKD repeat protein